MGFDIDLNLKWFRGTLKPKKNLRSVLGTDHAKMGLVRNCLNSIMRWLANMTILSGLHTANLSWQTRVGKPNLVSVNDTKTGVKHVCKLLASNRNMFANCFYAFHTHQLEFADTSLPTLVCRVKAALLFTRTFETWFFCFSRKAKGILHDQLFSDTLRAMCSGNKWYWLS